MSDKLELIKEQIGDALASWEESNGGKITNGWIHAANPVAITELLAELEGKDRRIAELEREPTIKHMRSVEEALIRATDMNSELEQRLAELQEDIKTVVNSLESREWAEHCTKTELGKRLEGEITRLHNEKSESNDE